MSTVDDIVREWVDNGATSDAWQPDFLLGGAPRAGTTQLQRHLVAHPGIYMGNRLGALEPHFITRATEGWPSWATETWETYRALFAEAEPGQIQGERSTWYLYARSTPEVLATRFKRTKMVVVLRNPVTRAHSSWSFNRMQGWEPCSNLMEALRLEAERPELGDSRYDVSAPDWMYVKAGRYFEQLMRFEAIRREGRLLILLYEDLVADPRTELARIFAFLGVDDRSAEAKAEARTNESRPPRLFFVSRLKASRAHWKKLIPQAARREVGKVLFRWNRGDPQPMPVDAARFVAEAVREDVAALSDMLQRNLVAAWLDPLARRG